MPAPGAPKGMGGMAPPGGEVPDEIAQMMGGSSNSGSSSGGGSSAGNPLASMGGNNSGGKINPAQMAAAQQAMGQGGLPGADGQNMDAAQAAQAQQASKNPPREMGSIKDELKRGVTDILSGIKEFFNINTWLGIKPENIDPQQEAQAKQLHSRYQQLDQEQQAVARKMYEEKMQKKKMEEEEAARKKQMEADQKAQSFEMPSGPQKGAKGQGGSKKQKAMTKLKQDRTTLSTTQGE